MIDVNKLINQDLIIAENLVINKNFDGINIIGNRILQNLFILNEKKLMVIGYLLKEVSMDLFLIQQAENITDQKLDQSKRDAKKCIEKMRLVDFSKQDMSMVWQPYFEFEIKNREIFLSDIEFKTYNIDFDFCKSASINYLEMIINTKSQLLRRNFKFIQRIRSELSTLFNLTGNKIVLLSYLYVRAAESVYRYSLHGDLSDEELESLASSIVQKIGEVLRYIESESEENLIKFVLSNIGDLMWEYRKYYTLYGELSGKFSEDIQIAPKALENIRKTIRESYSDKNK